MILSPEAVRMAEALPFTNAILGESMGRVAPLMQAWNSAAKAGQTITSEDGAALLRAALPAAWSAAPEPSRAAAPVAQASAVPYAPVPSPVFRPAVVDLAAPAKPAAQPPAGREESPPTATGQSGALLPVEVYAAIKAEVWKSNATLAGVLERHQLDEAIWHANERRQEEVLAQEAKEGAGELASHLRRALVAARASTTEPSAPTLSLEEYVELRAAVDAAEDAAQVLAAKNLSAEQWHRLRREWHQRSLGDPELAKRLRAKLAEARRAQRAARPSGG